MNFKTFLRTLVFLLMLFVVLYAGMNNIEEISFSFPGVLQKSVRAQAGIIFFVVLDRQCVLCFANIVHVIRRVRKEHV